MCMTLSIMCPESRTNWGRPLQHYKILSYISVRSASCLVVPPSLMVCRYLLVLEDEDIKLLLQAFQLSTSPCAAHPDAALLPVQMPARLLGTGRSHLLKVWPMLSCATPLCPQG